MRKKKLLSLLLSVLLLIGLMPVDQVFAAETGEVLWVNGVNIIDVPDKTVVCGAGSAVYDAETKTLTLTDATIDDGHDGVGIAAESYFNNKVLTVKLVGTNKIAPEPGNNLTMGIRTDGELLVEGDTAGSGTINIATKAADENTLIRGIYAYKGCEIKDVAVTLRDTTASGNMSSAIDANAFQEGYFKCSNATVNVSGYDTGINVPDGHINIDHSRVEIEGANRGVNGGEEVNNFRIKDSTVICTVSGENAVAVANGQDITIDNSQLTLSSTSSNAIFSAGKLVIENGSDVDAAGYYPALFGTTSISIKSGSKVKAVSTHDIAIFSKGFIQLDGVEIHAKGGSGCAAIAARVVKTSSVTDGPKIALANLVEKYGGKIAYISFVSAKDSENKIWTSFIHKGADSLQQNADERLVNALNEVRLGSADSFLADYTKVDEALAVIPSDLSIYTDATANAVIAARDAVLRGKIIDEQDLVDSWATAIEDAVKALVKKDVVDPGTETTVKYIVDSNTGARVEYADGSEFDNKIELRVTPVSKDEKSRLKNGIDEAAKGFTLAGLYDIKLFINGVIFQPGGKVKISIPLTEEMKAMTDLQVIYIDDQGNITIIPSEIVDGKIVFTTDHFSYYGVIGKAKASPDNLKSPHTGDNFPIIPLGLLAVLSCAVLLGSRLRRTD